MLICVVRGILVERRLTIRYQTLTQAGRLGIHLGFCEHLQLREQTRMSDKTKKLEEFVA